LFFNTAANPDLKIKVGISPVSTANALANIKAEIPGWDFNAVVNAADAKWNQALNKIKIRASDSVSTVFYTALYHSLFFSFSL